MSGSEGLEGLAAKFEIIFPHLDERQRRLLMAAEAQVAGHGGIRRVARAAGVREGTVSLGVRELESGEAPLGRARRPGGGRKRLADLDPGLRPALLALVEPDMRGDPMSPLRWTAKSTRKLAAELTRQGHRVSADTVGDLLREEGFSLQGNAKTIEGRQHPDRDAQFRYINEQARAHRASGEPVVSVDAKKKEQGGNHAGQGREYAPRGCPVAVRDHDFPDPGGPGMAIPYGIYDLAADTGWVNVGTDANTAAFAAESIRRWWNGAGAAAYPAARRLLITADAGGSNSYRTRAWKAGLAALAAGTGLEITCCHFPPGTSKWNKIEHRLFSHISMNWRGRPLTSHEVIVNTIAATTTATGLTVHAELDTGLYPAGIKISDAQLDALPLARHDWHGDWNYTLRSQPYDLIPIAAADPPGQPGPGRGWLCHPALTGLSPQEWDTLTATVMTLHRQQRETSLGKRRGHRPRLKKPGAGRRPVLTLADRLLATILHHRYALPCAAAAALFTVTPATISLRIRETSQLLDYAGHTIQPSTRRLTTLDDLRNLAATEGIAIPPRINTAC
jgi:transposase